MEFFRSRDEQSRAGQAARSPGTICENSARNLQVSQSTLDIYHETRQNAGAPPSCTHAHKTFTPKEQIGRRHKYLS